MNRAQRATFALMVTRFREQLGEAIRARREELGLSQKDLAAAAHVEEPQTVSRWERGLNQPGDLEAVAAALSWTVAEMMAGIQPPARIAQKHNIDADGAGEEGRLARIEGKLDRLMAFLEVPAVEAPSAGGLAARLAAIDESPPKKAPARRRTRPAGSRRKRA